MLLDLLWLKNGTPLTYFSGALYIQYFIVDQACTMNARAIISGIKHSLNVRVHVSYHWADDYKRSEASLSVHSRLTTALCSDPAQKINVKICGISGSDLSMEFTIHG